MRLYLLVILLVVLSAESNHVFGESGKIFVKFEWIALPTTESLSLIEEVPPRYIDSSALFERVCGLLKEDIAEHLHVADIQVKVGDQRAEYYYAGRLPFELGREPKGEAPELKFDGKDIAVVVKGMVEPSKDFRWLRLRIETEMMNLGRKLLDRDQAGAVAAENRTLFSMKLNTDVSIPLGRRSLIGVMSPQEGGKVDHSRKVLLFISANINRREPPLKIGAVEAAVQRQVTSIVEWIDLEKNDLSSLLLAQGVGGDDERMKAAVDRLIKDGKARLRDFTLIRSRSDRSIQSYVGSLEISNKKQDEVTTTQRKKLLFDDLFAPSEFGSDPRPGKYSFLDGNSSIFFTELFEGNEHLALNLDSGLYRNYDELALEFPLYATMITKVERLIISTDGRSVLGGSFLPYLRAGDELVPDSNKRTLLFIRTYLNSSSS